MYRKEEIIWGDGKGVKKSLKPAKEEITKNSASEYCEKGKFVIPDNKINKDGSVFKSKCYKRGLYERETIYRGFCSR